MQQDDSLGIRLSLTDVTETARNPQRVDIVVHYVPDAGGIVWGGRAQCGDHRCNNVTVRSDVPDLIDVGVPDYDAERVYRVALHELGHALGLGHAEPLNETNDLMGYGWSVPEPDTTPVCRPVISKRWVWSSRGRWKALIRTPRRKPGSPATRPAATASLAGRGDGLRHGIDSPPGHQARPPVTV